jgi:hypothetical protein
MDSFNTQDYLNEARGLDIGVQDAWQKAKAKHDQAYQALDDGKY